MKAKISVVIPNWNGRAFLAKSLPALEAAFEKAKIENEVIVVDNGSTDDSLAYLEQNHPQIKVIPFSKNQGFARACNEGARQAKFDLILLLNNDIYVTSEFIQPLIDQILDQNKIFGVSPLILKEKTKKLDFGQTLPKIERGLIRMDYRKPQKASWTFFASGGASLIDKGKFLELGGFDSEMFYFEDVDLGYRAWKRGWKVICEPKSKVFHEVGGTSRKIYSQEEIKTIQTKNQFFFIWKNIFEPSILVNHFVNLICLVPLSLILGKKHYYCGFWHALKSYRIILAKRRKEKLKQGNNYYQILSKLRTKL